MPILGADMEDGTLVEWRRKVGERVGRGDIIAEVETDKGLTEVEVFVDGVVERILVEPGTKVAVGTPLALIREDGGAAAAVPPSPTPAAPAAPAAPPVAPGAPAVAAAPARPATAPGEHVRASPAARRRAAELGVDLAGVAGSGPGGAVQVSDVERAAGRPGEVERAAGRPGEVERAAPGAPQPAGPPVAPAAAARARMRETIAAVMARSKREIPHYYLGTTIDLEKTVQWIARRNEGRPPAERLLPGVALVKAVALALREVPELNAVWSKDGLEQRPAIHVGVAIALRGGGLVAPAVHDTDKKTLDEVMRDMRDLVQRARAGTMRSSELSDPTITVTNLGDQGVESVFAVIYPPQVAIVGFGHVVERPWVVDGRVVPRRVVTASLSADHRASDGHRGARFLAALDRLLQEPEAL